MLEKHRKTKGKRKRINYECKPLHTILTLERVLMEYEIILDIIKGKR